MNEVKKKIVLLAFLFLTLFLGIYIYILTFLSWQNKPFPGFCVYYHLHIAVNYLPNWEYAIDKLPPNYKLSEADNVKFDNNFQFYKYIAENYKPGNIVEYKFTDGKGNTVWKYFRVINLKFSDILLLGGGIWGIIGVVFIVVPILIILGTSRITTPYTILALTGMVLATNFFTTLSHYLPPLFYPLNVISDIFYLVSNFFSVPVIFHLSLEYPYPLKFPGKRFLRDILYLLATLMSVVFVYSGYVLGNDLGEHIYTLPIALMAFWFIVVTGIRYIISLKKKENPLRVNFYKILFVSSIFSFLPSGIYSLLLPYITPTLTLDITMNLPLIIFPISLAYTSITLGEILVGKELKLLLIWLISFIALLFIYYISNFLFINFSPEKVIEQQIGLYFISIVLAIFWAFVVHYLMLDWLEFRLFSIPPNTEYFGSYLQSLNTIGEDIKVIEELLRDFLKVKFVSYKSIRELPEDITRLLSQFADVFQDFQNFPKASKIFNTLAFQEILNKYGLGLIIPVYLEGKVLKGGFLIGPKYSSESFYEEEIITLLSIVTYYSRMEELGKMRRREADIKRIEIENTTTKTLQKLLFPQYIPKELKNFSLSWEMKFPEEYLKGLMLEYLYSNNTHYFIILDVPDRVLLSLMGSLNVKGLLDIKAGEKLSHREILEIVDEALSKHLGFNFLKNVSIMSINEEEGILEISNVGDNIVMMNGEIFQGEYIQRVLEGVEEIEIFTKGYKEEGNGIWLKMYSMNK